MSAATQVCTRRPTSTWPTCSCPDCWKIRTRLRKLCEGGRYARVPADAAKTRVLQMVEAGMTPAAIASVTGINRGTLREALKTWRQGRSRDLNPHNARLIMAADPERWPTSGRVATTGCTRRLRALAVMGHGLREVHEHSGISMMTLSRLRSAAVTGTRPGIAAAVAGAYDALSMRAGTNAAGRRRALAAGWAPPLAWDDDSIDDPAARSDTGAHVPRVGGRRVEVEDVEFLLDQGVRATQLHERLGVERGSIQEALRRGGRRDLLDRIYRGTAA